MPKVNTSATLWPAIRLQVERIIRELIHEHTASAVMFANTYGQRIQWEQRLEMWLAFSLANPAIEIGHEEFMEVLRDVHGLWPAGRRTIRRAR